MSPAKSCNRFRKIIFSSIVSVKNTPGRIYTSNLVLSSGILDSQLACAMFLRGRCAMLVLCLGVLLVVKAASEILSVLYSFKVIVVALYLCNKNVFIYLTWSLWFSCLTVFPLVHTLCENHFIAMQNATQ